MATFAENMKALALRMIQKFGRASIETFGRANNDEYTTSSLTRVSNADDTFTAYCAPLNFKLKEMGSVSNNTSNNGNTVLEGEKMLWIEANAAGYVPAVADTISLSSVVYRILSVQPQETGSVEVAYLCKIGV